MKRCGKALTGFAAKPMYGIMPLIAAFSKCASEK
jgi:hypothetical protein